MNFCQAIRHRWFSIYKFDNLLLIHSLFGAFWDTVERFLLWKPQHRAKIIVRILLWNNRKSRKPTTINNGCKQSKPAYNCTKHQILVRTDGGKLSIYIQHNKPSIYALEQPWANWGCNRGPTSLFKQFNFVRHSVLYDLQSSL